MLCFSNKGEIDLRAAVILGVNVKPEAPDGSIGQFGTGLKYAIAGVLRLGGKIEIWQGMRSYRFEARNVGIRGKDFGLCYMGQQGDWQMLGFTTELGKHWEPWMLYRELLSNTMDEPEGQVQELTPGALAPVAKDQTTIMVWCKELETVHESRDGIFLDKTRHKLLWASPALEVWSGAREGLLYRGILASQEKSWEFTFNVLEGQMLTEDRTFKYLEDVRSVLGQELVTCENEDVLEHCLSEGAEYGLDYSWSTVEPSPAFRKVVLQRLRERKGVPYSARRAVERRDAEAVRKAEQPEVPSDHEQMLLHEPPKGEEPKTTPWDWKIEIESQLEAERKRAEYWKTCAELLAARLAPLAEAEEQYLAELEQAAVEAQAESDRLAQAAERGAA